MDPARLPDSRLEFHRRLRGLRRSLGGAAGWRPRRDGWWVLLLAGAVGVAIGSRVGRPGAGLGRLPGPVSPPSRPA